VRAARRLSAKQVDIAGFCGAINGAKRAKTTNTVTSTMPIDASTLRRPNVAGVPGVEIAIKRRS